MSQALFAAKGQAPCKLAKLARVYRNYVDTVALKYPDIQPADKPT